MLYLYEMYIWYVRYTIKLVDLWRWWFISICTDRLYRFNGNVFNTKKLEKWALVVYFFFSSWIINELFWIMRNRFFVHLAKWILFKCFRIRKTCIWLCVAHVNVFYCTSVFHSDDETLYHFVFNRPLFFILLDNCEWYYATYINTI